MRFSIISIGLLFAGCSSAYQSLVLLPGEPGCLEKFKPVFQSDLYATQVDVMGKSISGLLFFKSTADSAVRTVFMNEAGITFFDFEFLRDGSFRRHRVIPALDKRPVLRTLRRDFELFMMLKVGKEKAIPYRRENEIFYAFPNGKETDYMITNTDCSSLLRMEKGTRKKKTEIRLFSSGRPAPDSIYVRHADFPMTITLKKLVRE